MGAIENEIVGAIAAICTTSSFLPQAYRVFKTKKTRDLSIHTYLLFAFGVFMWLCYGVITRSYSITIANIITLPLCLYVLFAKLKYK